MATPHIPPPCSARRLVLRLQRDDEIKGDRLRYLVLSYCKMSNQFASEKQLPAAMRAAAEFDETQLRHALKAARIGVWELNPATGDLAWDGTVREIVGAEPECAPTWQDHFLPAIHPDDLASLKAALSVALTRAAPVDIDVRVVGACSRKQTWAHLTGSIQVTACGRRLIGTARDITVERLRHAEMLADRRIWADMVEAHDDAMVAIDVNLAFTALNRAYVTACQDIFGREFLVGEKVSDVLDHVPSVRVTSLKLWSRALAGQSFEARVGGSELNERAFEHKFRPLHDAEGSIVGAYHVSREVTGSGCSGTIAEGSDPSSSARAEDGDDRRSQRRDRS